SVPFIVYHCMLAVDSATYSACGTQTNACKKGAQLPVASSFSSATTCTCARDPLTSLPAGVPLPADSPAPKLETSEANDRYGSALVRGDFNGDQIPDLAVGVPNENIAGFEGPSGIVMLYYGTAEGLYPWTWITQGSLGVSTAGDQFGASLAAADFDDDGYDD